MRLLRAGLLLTAALSVLAVGCGTAGQRADSGSSDIGRQLVELERLPAPASVPQARWLELKRILAANLTARRNDRAVAGAPTANGAKTTLGFDPATGVLSWDYYSPGDYDQNGEVNISDLTPLGLHFGASNGSAPFDKSSVESVVDGDNNGEINISDVTPIGAAFGSTVSAYNVYVSSSAGDYPAGNGAASGLSPLGTVQFSAATGETSSQRLHFEFTVPDPQPADIYWVRPSDGDGEGTPSNMSGPAAPIESGVTLNQLTIENGAGTQFENTDWGEAVVTFTGVSELLFFSMTFNGEEVILNVPLVSTQGVGVQHSVVVPFALGVPSGTPVTAGSVDYTLERQPKSTSRRKASSEENLSVNPVHRWDKLTAGPEIWETPPVTSQGFKSDQSGVIVGTARHQQNFIQGYLPYYERGKHIPNAVSDSLHYLQKRFNLPIGGNTDKQIDLNTMIQACGFITYPGSPPGRIDATPLNWPENKNNYMREHNYPIYTTVTRNVSEARRALEQDYDVEIVISHFDSEKDWQEVYPITAITQYDSGGVAVQYPKTEQEGQFNFPQYEHVLDLHNKNTLGFNVNGVATYYGNAQCAYVIEKPKFEQGWEEIPLLEDQIGGAYAHAAVLPDGDIALSSMYRWTETHIVATVLGQHFLDPQAEPVDVDPLGLGPDPGPTNDLELLPSGALACVFQDRTSGDHKVVCSISTDDCATWGDQNVVCQDDSSFVGDYISCEVTADGRLGVVSCPRGGELQYCQSTDGSCTAFTASQSVPGSYSVECHTVQDSAGEICVAYQDTDSCHILSNFDCSDGTHNPDVVAVSGDCDGFNMCYDENAGRCYLLYNSTVDGLNLIESSDFINWSAPLNLGVPYVNGASPGMAVVDGNLVIAYWGNEDIDVNHQQSKWVIRFNGGVPGEPELLGTSYTSFGHQDILTVFENPLDKSPLIFAPDEAGLRLVVHRYI